MQVNELASKAFAAWSRTMCGDAGMRPIYWSEEGCVEQRAWISAVEAVVADLRIRELEAELAVRDNSANEVLRILREATGKRDFHSEMEAAEWAAKMLAEARKDTERLAWCSLHKACAVEYWGGGWRVQNIYQVFMTDSHETPRAAIDAAMKTDWKVTE